MSTEVVEAIVVFLLSGIGATVLFLMPGHLLRTAFQRGVRSPEKSERVFVANTVVGALVVHAAALPWTVGLGRAIVDTGVMAHLWQLTAWALVVLVVVPTVSGSLLARLSRVRRPRWLARALDLLGLAHHIRTTEAWHWFLGGDRGAYMRVRLKDKRTVLGYYGTGSFASSDASNRDLYLERQYRPGQGKVFGPELGPTRGVWISGDQIVSIELFDGAPRPPATAPVPAQPTAPGGATDD